MNRFSETIRTLAATIGIMGAAAAVSNGCGSDGGGGDDCQPGTDGCACNFGSCFAGLMCISEFCVNPGNASVGMTSAGSATSGPATSDDGSAGDEVSDDGNVGADCSVEPCEGLTYCDLSDNICKPGCANDDVCDPGFQCDLASHTCEEVPWSPCFSPSELNCDEACEQIGAECEEDGCEGGTYAYFATTTECQAWEPGMPIEADPYNCGSWYNDDGGGFVGDPDDPAAVRCCCGG